MKVKSSVSFMLCLCFAVSKALNLTFVAHLVVLVLRGEKNVDFCALECDAAELARADWLFRVSSANQLLLTRWQVSWSSEQRVVFLVVFVFRAGNEILC